MKIANCVRFSSYLILFKHGPFNTVKGSYINSMYAAPTFCFSKLREAGW